MAKVVYRIFLKPCILFAIGVFQFVVMSPDGLDHRWKVFCDDSWFENCRNIGVLWKCEKFYQCVDTWRNNSADYNEYFLQQLNATIDDVIDIDGNLNIAYLPIIEYNVIKIDTAIHSAPNPFVTHPDIDNDNDTYKANQ